jgi:hypothetical protein
LPTLALAGTRLNTGLKADERAVAGQPEKILGHSDHQLDKERGESKGMKSIDRV